MNNFLHVLVHAASDSMARWADWEVAARWVRLFPVRSAGNFDWKVVDTHSVPRWLEWVSTILFAGVGVHDSVSATKPCNAVAPA